MMPEDDLDMSDSEIKIIPGDGPVTETVEFRIAKIRDTHGSFDVIGKIYTIPVDGTYVIEKTYKAGDVIEDPISVRRIGR